MKLTAVVDRIVEDVAVLLIGPNEIPVNFPIALIPEAREGAVLSLSIEELQSEEQARRSEVEGLLAKLIAKRRSD